MKSRNNCWKGLGWSWKCANKAFETKALLKYMQAVPDPRCERKKKHNCAEILTCLVIGYLAGRTTLRRCLKWCEKHLVWLRQYLPLENGVASPSTVCRLLAGIDEELFALEFMEWIGEILNTRGRHICIDVKALRAATAKVKDYKTPMVLNAIDAVTGLVMAQFPIQDKECEITEIPKLLELLNIKECTVTIDAIGTQTEIMKQIIKQEGHFVLTVKRNQPQSYEEIMEYFGEMEADYKKMHEDVNFKPKHPEMMKKYEEIKMQEKNRGRHETRCYRICGDVTLLTKTQKEWSFIKTVGKVSQIRIPVERDADGNDITPDAETFLEKGSRRKKKPNKGDEGNSDIQDVGMISDMTLSAERMGQIKRAHWAIENKLHHVLDDTFREDRSPAKKSKNNLALIRKFAYNILRIYMLLESCSSVMTEAMDDFCDDHTLIEKYVFNGIKSLT